MREHGAFLVVRGYRGGADARGDERMLTRLCPLCGRLTRLGTSCECQAGRHQRYDKRQRDRGRAAFYHATAWTRTQAAVKARAGGCDEYLRATEGRLIPADTVHHITPLEDDPAGALAPENLILVSRRTHKWIHDHYAMGAAEKQAMQDRLRAALARTHAPSWMT